MTNTSPFEPTLDQDGRLFNPLPVEAIEELRRKSEDVGPVADACIDALIALSHVGVPFDLTSFVNAIPADKRNAYNITEVAATIILASIYKAVEEDEYTKVRGAEILRGDQVVVPNVQPPTPQPVSQPTNVHQALQSMGYVDLMWLGDEDPAPPTTPDPTPVLPTASATFPTFNLAQPPSDSETELKAAYNSLTYVAQNTLQRGELGVCAIIIEAASKVLAALDLLRGSNEQQTSPTRQQIDHLRRRGRL